MSECTPVTQFFFVQPSADQAREDMRAMLKNKAARRALRRLLAAAGTFEPSMHATAERITEYREGQRAVGLLLATWIEDASPGETAKLMTESAHDRTRGR